MKGYYVEICGGSFDDAWHDIKDNKIYTNYETAKLVRDEYNESIKPENIKAKMVMPYELVEKYYNIPYDDDNLNSLFEKAGVAYNQSEVYSEKKANMRSQIRWDYEEKIRKEIMDTFVAEHPDYNDDVHEQDYKLYSKIRWDELGDARIIEIEIIDN